jgi:replicative DNA helicase
LKAREGIRLVVIDYLQLIVSGEKSGNRQEQVADVSRRLKGMAKELSIPVVALAQLNRKSEVDGEGVRRKPRLSDLRESGSIEADADVVLLLHQGDQSERVVECILAKNRNGPTGEFPLVFLKPYSRFENVTARAATGRRAPDPPAQENMPEPRFPAFNPEEPDMWEEGR